MGKQGQHKHDAHDPRISRGPNNPDKSVEITTGSYKKPETYKKQAAEHEDPYKVAQHDKNEWRETTLDKPRNSHEVRARNTSSGRSGSESGR